MAFAGRWLKTSTGRFTLAGFVLAVLILGIVLLLLPPSVHAPPQTAPKTLSPVTSEVRARIDRWIAANQLNPYGDPPDTMYAGGNPLFDPQTGRSRDRYDYILEKHPELGAGQE